VHKEHIKYFTEDKTSASNVIAEVLLLQFLTPLHVSVLTDHHQRENMRVPVTFLRSVEIMTVPLKAVCTTVEFTKLRVR
jgi:hypothetical protein